MAEISHIIETLDGDTANPCSASELNEKVIAPFHDRLQGALAQAIGETTIADLCDQITPESGGTENDFTI